MNSNGQCQHNFLKKHVAVVKGEIEKPPKRPLSAYNFFFKAERLRILGVEPNDEANRMRGKDRPHRKTPGMIGFRGLAKHVGDKWKALSDEERAPYFEQFENDKRRYQIEIKRWGQKQKFMSANVGEGSSLHYSAQANCLVRAAINTTNANLLSENARSVQINQKIIISRIHPEQVPLDKHEHNKLCHEYPYMSKLSSKFCFKFGLFDYQKQEGQLDPLPIEKMAPTLTQLELELIHLLDQDFVQF